MALRRCVYANGYGLIFGTGDYVTLHGKGDSSDVIRILG